MGFLKVPAAKKYASAGTASRTSSKGAKASGSTGGGQDSSGKMSFDEWKQRKQSGTGTQSSGSSQSSSSQSSGKMTFGQWQAEKQRKEQEKQQAAEQARAENEKFAQDWVNSTLAALESARTATSGWSSPEDYTAIQKQIKDAQGRSSWMQQQYAGNKDASAYVNELVNGLTTAGTALEDASKYYGQWDSKDAYDMAAAYSTRKGRQQRYKDNQKKLADLQEELEEARQDAGPLYNGVSGRYDDGLIAVRDTPEIADIQAQIAKVQTEMRNYERGNTDENGFYYGSKKADDVYDVMQNADFAEKSANRDFGNATKAQYDKWYYDFYGGDVIDSKTGQVLESKRGTNDAQGDLDSLSIHDPLGFYLDTEKSLAEGTPVYVSGGVQARDYDAILAKSSADSWDQLSDDEVSVYYYLMNTQGAQAASDFLDSMKVTLNRRATEQNNADTAKLYQESDLLGKILLNAAGTAASIVSNPAAQAEDVVRAVTGQEQNPYSPLHSGLQFGGTIRGATAQDIDTATGGWAIPELDFSAGDIYQALMSGAESAVLVGIVGPAATYLMAGNAAEAEATRLYESGASGSQILMGAATAGFAEAFFEDFSIENLVRMNDPKTVWDIFANVLKQGGIEASEEMGTEICNILTNAVIMNSESDWQKAVEEHDGDAKAAFLDKVQQVLQAGMGGFVSAAPSAGARSLAGYGMTQYEDYQTGKAIRGTEGGTDALAQLAREATADSKYAKAAQRQTAKVQEGAKGLFSEARNNLNAGKLMSTISDAITSQGITDLSGKLQEHGFSAKEASKIAGAIAARSNGLNLSEAQEKMLEKAESNQEVWAALNEYSADKESKSAQLGSSERSFLRGVIRGDVQQYLQEGVGRKQAGTAEQARQTEAKEQSGSEKAIRSVLDQYSQTIDKQSANAIVQGYQADSGMDADTYARAAAQAYMYGFAGESMETADNGSLSSQLSIPTRAYAYKLGADSRAARNAAQQSGLVRDAYTKSNLSAVDTARIDRVAKALGVRVTFADSVLEGSANGQLSGNTITIEKNNPNPVTFLFGHELTHWMQANAEKEYTAFRDAIASEADVQSEAAELLKLYQARGVSLTEEGALDEAAANYAGRLMEGGDVLDQFLVKNKQNKPLLQRVLDGVRDLLAKLTGKDKKQLETVEGKLLAAMEATERNTGNSAAGRSETSNAQFSLKTFPNGMQYVQASRQVIFGNDPDAWSNQLENYINKEIRQGNDVQLVGADGEILLLTATSAGKLSSYYTSDGRTMSQEAYGRKVDAAAHIDELAQSSKWNGRQSKDHDSRHGSMASRGWTYRDAYFMDFDGKYYQVTISAVKSENGTAIYNIGQMQERSIPQMDGSSTLTNGAQRGNASKSSISQQEQNVNRKFSLKGSEGATAEAYAGVNLAEDGSVYSYDFLTSLPDMQVTTLLDLTTLRNAENRIDTGKVLAEGMKNARTVGTERDGKVFVTNRYTGRELRIDNATIRHSLNGEVNRLITNARMGAVIGDIVQNAVPINALNNKAAGVSGTYAMVAYATDASGREFAAVVTVEQRTGNVSNLETYDVTHAVSGRQKRGSQADTKSQGVYPIKAATVSIADVLQVVNSTHQSILPNDVLSAFNETRNPEGYYADRVKFSLKGSEEAADAVQLQKENDLLRERVAYWKGQTRRTGETTTDRKSVEKAAKALLKSYDADIDVQSVTERLQRLYDFLASGHDGNDELTYEAARSQAEDIAQDIARNAVVTDTEMREQYADLRAYLRTTPLVLSEADRAGIQDYNDFRKQNFGSLRIKNGEKSNIDDYFQQLGEMWPEFFNEDSVSNPSDQLETIEKVAYDIAQVEEYNPFSQNMDQAVSGIANEIMETFFDLPETGKTFADKQAFKIQEAKAAGKQRLGNQKERYEEKLSKLREANRERVQKAIERERGNREKQVTKLKEKYAAQTEASRERQKARELRGKITRRANSLSQKLLRPTDTAHIPEALRSTVANLLGAINQESSYTVDEEGRRHRNDEGAPTKRTEAFRALRDQYDAIVKEESDFEGIVDPDIQELLQEAENLKSTRLSDMTSEQLETVWKAVRAVEASISNAGKVLSKTKYQKTADWANALAESTAGRKGKKVLTKAHMSLDLETPYTFFSHYGEAGKAVYRMLRDAQDQQQRNVDRVTEAVQAVVDGKTARALEKSTRTFEVGGENLTLTTAQVMELYLLAKREQALGHLLKGGIYQPEIKSEKIERGNHAIKLTEGDIASITGVLTDSQRSIADGLQSITGGLLADMGNEASMQAYGYKKFTEKAYWPIRSAGEGVHSNVEKSEQNVRSIKNIGMAKALTQKASNAVDLPGIFTTFANHASDMTDYAAWLIPMEDANRLYNFQFRDDNGIPTGYTVRGMLDEYGGKKAQKYWANLMANIQNGINQNGDSTLWDVMGKSIGSFKGAAVGANIRVVLQQPTAFFRAAAVMAPGDLAKGLVRGVTEGNGWEKAKRYAAIAARKDNGGFDISAPFSLKETLFGKESRVQRLNDALSAPAGVADAVTWGRLWNASEWQVAEQNKALRPGSEAFYAETARVFTEMIDQTQVVDGVLQRSQAMRSSNAVMKQATSFMGEPLMSLNLMMRTWDQFRYEQDPAKRGKALKAMGRSAAALTVTSAVNAVVQSVIDAMRSDDDKKYKDKFLEAFTGYDPEEESVWKNALKMAFDGNFLSGINPVQQVPFLKDAVSIAEGYDVSRTEMEVISDVIGAAKIFLNSIDGNGQRTPAYAINNLFAASAKLFGIPVSNLKRDVWALPRSIAAETGNVPMMYEMEKAVYNISYSGNKSRFYSLLYKALEQEDLDTYKHIRKDLMDHMGIDGESISGAMKSKYKANRERDNGYSLSQEALDLIGYRETNSNAESEPKFSAKDLGSRAYEAYEAERSRSYREMEDGLTGDSYFQGLDPEAQDKAYTLALQLAKENALADNSDGQYESSTKWVQLAEEAEAMGIEEYEYILFRLAYSMAETEYGEDGKAISGQRKSDHVRDWLEDYDLTDMQRAFLWGTVYSSEW